ncbi:MAG: flotillin-like protein FloA, partial [Planctomycetota bacterium]|nr:flotillin-like protein FloA [Planctomycetota bacterium]
EIVLSKIALVQANIPVETKDLEAHFLAGGNVAPVARALIAADRARIPLDFKTAAGIDLAGRDVLDAIQTSVIPKVIDCPDPRKAKREVAAVAKDGIQVLARARVTVRTNLKQLVGGAQEETIIARVGEGIVSTIGSSETHMEVLENPDRISKTVLSKALDAGTAYTILSIDIADVDIGQNIGARLQADQAEADKRVAQARAEKRRALAVALEQENKAGVVENQAKVVLAEAEVPKALAEALRSGNLGVMDYFNLKNVQADTEMRRSLGEGSEPDATPEV